MITSKFTVTVEPAQTGVPVTITLEMLCALTAMVTHCNIVDSNKIKRMLLNKSLVRILDFWKFMNKRKHVFIPNNLIHDFLQSMVNLSTPHICLLWFVEAVSKHFTDH